MLVEVSSIKDGQCWSVVSKGGEGTDEGVVLRVGSAGQCWSVVSKGGEGGLY